MKANEKDRLFQALTRSISLLNAILLLVILHLALGMALGFATTVFRLTQVLFSQPII